MKESKLFMLPIHSVLQSSFGVVEMPPETENNTTFRIKPSDIIFLADGSLAGDYIGLGIIRKMTREEKCIGIACNPKDVDELGGEDGKRATKGE